MRKILGYLFTPLHYLVFGLILVVFEVFQRVALALGGYAWHKRTVDVMNFCLTKSLLFIGTNCHWINEQDLPMDRPLIVVSNHQSLYDIAPFFWYLRRHHMKFVSKIELGKGFPSVSYNLRHGGSVLIDRKDPRQAISALKKFGEYIEENNYAACIFPEGTRSRDGRPKRFATQGLKTLLKYTPSALVVPVTVNQVWRINQYGNFPLSFGESPTWTVHPPIDPLGKDADTVIAEAEAAIIRAIL